MIDEECPDLTPREQQILRLLAEGRDPGDLTTIEDPAALEQIRAAVTPN